MTHAPMLAVSISFRRVIEAGLLVAVAVAVLAFGGTAPQWFAITQGIVFLLGIFQLVVGRSFPSTAVGFPVIVPFLLIVLVLLQILPLPISIVQAMGMRTPAPPGHSYLTISAAPYQTVSQLLMLMTCVIAFYLVLMLCEAQKTRKRLVFGLLTIGVFEAFYGLIQYLTGWQQIFTYVKKFYLQEATGTYINRNHYSGLLEMILPFAVVMALQKVWILRRKVPDEPSRTKKILSSMEFPFLVLWIFVAAVLFAAVVFSRSRMGIISALVSLITILARAGTSSLPTRTRIATGGLFLLGIVGLSVWIGSDPVMTRFETLDDQYNHPGQDRLSIWRDTLQLIRRDPLLGSGFGTFAVVYPSVQTAFLNHLVDYAHCDYLQVAAELGVPGAILVFGAIFWILGLTVWHCSRAGREDDKAIALACLGSITAISLHSLADFNLYIPANALVFAVVLALAWSNATRIPSA